MISFEELATTYCCRRVRQGQLPAQYSAYDVEVPFWAKERANLKAAFANSQYGNGRFLRLSEMLAKLDLTFEGRPQPGLDETRNIARFIKALIESPVTIATATELAGAGTGDIGELFAGLTNQTVR